jgi:hypothetical protein
MQAYHFTIRVDNDSDDSDVFTDNGDLLVALSSKSGNFFVAQAYYHYIVP